MLGCLWSCHLLDVFELISGVRLACPVKTALLRLLFLTQALPLSRGDSASSLRLKRARRPTWSRGVKSCGSQECHDGRNLLPRVLLTAQHSQLVFFLKGDPVGATLGCEGSAAAAGNSNVSYFFIYKRNVIRQLKGRAQIEPRERNI